MVFINTEGKFNENTYLFDGRAMNIPKFLSVYVIENNGIRLMIDTPQEQYCRKFIRKLQELNLYPIHKIILTHSHFDHISGTLKLKKLNKEEEIKIFASENAIDNLKNPDKINEVFSVNITPIENVNPLKEGDIIDVNGLSLEIMNLFGHTMDSIGVFDKSNKNLFVGDALIDRIDRETFMLPFMPPEFNELELLLTFKKVREIKPLLNSISLGHFGVWKDNDMIDLMNEMEELYQKAKTLIIKWYNEDPSPENITLKYHDTFIPNSKSHPKENIKIIEFLIDAGLKAFKNSGFI
ncbi:MAG: MBL fold metallo-hydrolase [Promethearchaeota archaeon]